MKKVVPFLKWAGGKRWLAANHLSLFPRQYCRYIEPFLGSGAVFFALNPKRATLSDLNQELVLTYQAIRDDWKGVVSVLEEHQRLHSTEHYYSVRGSSPSSVAERAARLIYLNRTCWNALYRVNMKGEFNVPIGAKTAVLMDTDDFEEVSRRLQDVELLCSDFDDIIRGASGGDLVYADPPYTVRQGNNGFVKYNDRLFRWEDQVRLRNSLAYAVSRDASVVVSSADHSSIVELYGGDFLAHHIERSSVIAGTNSARGKCRELLICGGGTAT